MLNMDLLIFLHPQLQASQANSTPAISAISANTGMTPLNVPQVTPSSSLHGAQSVKMSSLTPALQGVQTISMLNNGQLQQYLLVSPSQLTQLTQAQAATPQLLVANQVNYIICWVGLMKHISCQIL